MKHKDNEIILFEDNHLIFANKPAGTLTQPNESSSDSLEDHLKAHLKEKHKKSGNVFLHAVHRLDKAVSGIVLFAKTSKALSRLNAQIREKEIEKCYLALCEGHFKNKKGVLEHYLLHDDHKAKVVSQNSKDAKLSTLSYEALDLPESRSLVKIMLTTGRYHQIRCQLAAICHPIIGDKKYGSKIAFEQDAIALHHYQMSLIHPVTKEKLEITYLAHWVQKEQIELLKAQDQAFSS